MRPSLLLAPSAVALLGVASPALASKKTDQFRSEVEATTLSGTVEVPLYDVPGYEGLPVIAATVGETRLFLALLPEADEIVLSGGPGVGALKLEAKEHEKKSWSTAEVGQIKIGEMALDNVTVAANFPVSIQRTSQTSMGAQGVLSLDGYIGLKALSGVAWAIVPSAGVVRFAPASEGDALVAALGGGTAVAAGVGSASFVEPYKTKRGKKKVWRGSFLWTEAKVGETAVKVRLGTNSDTRVARSLTVGAPGVDAPGGERIGSAKLNLDGQAVDMRVVVDGGFDTVQQYALDPEEVVVYGQFGREVLAHYDYSHNNATGAIAFRLATKAGRHDPVPLMLADAEDALKKAMEKPADAEEEVQKDTTLPRGSAAAWTRVAKAREAAHDTKGALEAWKTAAEFEPNGCKGWLDYGARVIAYSQPAEAKEALEKASSLYHGWWDWHALVRDELNEILEDAAKEGADYYFNPEDIGFVEVREIRERDVAMGAPAPLMPESGALIKSQPEACIAADGLLARIEFLAGNHSAVESLYRDRFDIDPYLADIYGVSALASGQTERAHEAVRQAIILEWRSGPDAYRRLALAEAFAKSGDLASAQKVLDRAVVLSPDDIVVMDRWRANSNALVGDKLTLQALNEMSEARPTVTATHLAWAAQAQQMDRQGAIKKALERADASLAMSKVHYPNMSSTWINATRLELLRGDLDKAAEYAKRATSLAPEDGLAWLVAAEVDEAKGDGSNATVHRKRAAKTATHVVGVNAGPVADSVK